MGLTKFEPGKFYKHRFFTTVFFRVDKVDQISKPKLIGMWCVQGDGKWFLGQEARLVIENRFDWKVYEPVGDFES